MTAADERIFVLQLEEIAELRPDPAVTHPLTEDPDDVYLVALAQAEHVPLVSRERSILRTHPDGVEVLHPDELSERLNRRL